MQQNLPSAVLRNLIRGRTIRIFLVTACASLLMSLPLSFLLGLDLGAGQEPALPVLAGLSVQLIFLLFWAAVLELYYQVVRIPSALLLRIENVWNFAAPAICIFLITAEPMIRWSGLLDEGQAIPAIVDSVPAIFLACATLLILFLFPLFRGMNASFLLAGVIAARFILLPSRLGPLQSTEHYIAFASHAIVLSFLVFAFLQSRRRLDLSPDYETFRLPVGVRFFPLFGVFMLPALYLLFKQLGIAFPSEVPLMLCLYLSAHWFVSNVVLNRDNRKEKVSLLLPSLLLFTGLAFGTWKTGTGQHLNTAFRFSVFSSESVTFFAAFLDRDRDGNSSWPGFDPNDDDPSIRSDFSSPGSGVASADGLPRTGAEPEDPELMEKRPAVSRPSSDVRLLTVVVSKMDTAPEKTGNLTAGYTDSIPFTLRNLLHNWQPVLHPGQIIAPGPDVTPAGSRLDGASDTSFGNRSILSDYVDAGYRTICVGIAPYFTHEHPSRLDSGCQIFVPLGLAGPDGELIRLAELNANRVAISPEMEGRPAGPALEEEGAGALYQKVISIGLQEYRKYREDRTFLWVHMDLSDLEVNWSMIAGQVLSNVNERSDFRDTVLLAREPVALVWSRPGSMLRSADGPGLSVASAAPWSRGFHEALFGPFLFPFRSFSVNGDQYSIQDKMTGMDIQARLPWNDVLPGKERRIENPVQ